MRVYLMRHGPAASQGAWTGEDDHQTLTAEGRDSVDAVAEQLVLRGVALDRLVTSPLTRARETAEIVAKRLGAADRLEVDSRLQPGFDFEDLASILSEHPHAEALMFVGHQPDMSAVISRLIGGGSVQCQKGAVARVDLFSVEEPGGSLAWLLAPASLDAERKP